MAKLAQSILGDPMRQIDREIVWSALCVYASIASALVPSADQPDALPAPSLPDCLSYTASQVLSRRCYGKQRCKGCDLGCVTSCLVTFLKGRDQSPPEQGSECPGGSYRTFSVKQSSLRYMRHPLVSTLRVDVTP